MKNIENIEKENAEIDHLKRIHSRLVNSNPEKNEILSRFANIISDKEYKNLEQEIQAVEMLKHLSLFNYDNSIKKLSLKQDKFEKKIAEITKKFLFLVVMSSLNNAVKEMEITGRDFTEEALRYIVIAELSKCGIWGSFPNTNNKKPKILFEKAYRKKKIGSNKSLYKPDIVSISSEGCLLVVELKITNDRKDIRKCLEYLDINKGKESYKLALVIFAIPKGFKGVGNELLNYREVHFEKRKNKAELKERLLVGFVEWGEESEKGKEKYIEPVVDWIENFTYKKYG